MRKLFLNLKSDESLMLSYQQGEARAFEVLYLRHKAQLFNYLYRSCQNPALVEDLAHDVWLSVIRRIEHYRSTATFKTYLYRIAWNKLVDHWRKSDKHQSDQEFDETLHTMDEPHSDQTHLLNALAQAINQLPLEQRTTFLLKEQGFSLKEIANITCSKQETVKSRLRYSNKTLRSSLEAEA